MRLEKKNINSKTRLISYYLCLVILISSLSACVVVDEGTVGVKKRFGKVADEPLSPGVHLFIPVANEVEVWDIKTRLRQMQLDLPSKEGLIVQLEASLNYRPVDAVKLRKTVGPDYLQRVLDPEMANVFREVLGKQRVDELIRNPEVLTTTAEEALKSILQDRGILVENLLVTDLGLPVKFKDSIEKKLQAKQRALEKEFELEQAKKDAEIEIARAEGAAKAQEIVKKTLSQEYLQYLWISTLNDNPNVIYVSTEANMPMFRTISDSGKKVSKAQSRPVMSRPTPPSRLNAISK